MTAADATATPGAHPRTARAVLANRMTGSFSRPVWDWPVISGALARTLASGANAHKVA